MHEEATDLLSFLLLEHNNLGVGVGVGDDVM